LSNSAVTLPGVDPQAQPVWHLFVVKVSERDLLQKSLRERGIATGIHYPLPLHLQPAYSRLGILAGTLPVTEWTASHVLSLPMYPELTPQQIDIVGQAVAEITLKQDICVF
jgi:dTDP-4-amino-4,6-dideoxygalactose transaminase